MCIVFGAVQLVLVHSLSYFEVSEIVFFYSGANINFKEIGNSITKKKESYFLNFAYKANRTFTKLRVLRLWRPEEWCLKQKVY